MAAEHAADLLPAKIALIGALGVGAQWLAWRLQWPAIVLMSAAGLIAGPVWAAAFGAPLIDPVQDFGELLRPMIAIAVALILFEGGLALELEEIRSARKAVRRMVFPGALIGWVLGTFAARWGAGLPWDIAALLGGLLVVTGPTVILPLLRQARLSGRAGAVLKWEGIVNDPVGALLAVLVYEVIRFTGEGRSWMEAAGWIGFAAVLGGALGVAAGVGLAHVFRRGLAPEFLKSPIIIAAVIGCFVVADRIAHETGLLAVTTFGLTLANARIASISEMRRFKETIAVMLVSGVFVILTATLTPETLAALDWRAAAFVAAMLFVVRPATVWLSTIGAELTWRERLLVGWIAPRGVVAVAVAGFFATELVALGRPEGAALTPLTFAMVFTTVIVHGFTITPLARRLNLSSTGVEGVLIVGAANWSLGLAKALKDLDIPVTVADTNWLRLGRARLDGVPTYFGEVLSEAADHKLDHAKVGWLIAATANDAYNALVCVEYAPELGRHRVFQLPSAAEASGREEAKGIAFTARGRTLLKPGRGFDALASDWWKGWRFRTTRLSEEYTLETFLAERGDADLVIERRPDGKIVLLGGGAAPKGGPNAVILSFGPPKIDRTGPGPAQSPSGSSTPGA